MEDSDFIIPTQSGQAKAAASIPQFFTEPVHSPFLSAQDGRERYVDTEMVRVLIIGDRRTQPVYEVTDEHRQRWSKEYAAFKAGEEAPVEGTPLVQWPPIGAARAKEFALLNIKTVEQLAHVGDNALQNLGMGAHALRRQAQVFLEVAAKGTAPIARMVEENQRLAARNAVLERTQEEQGAALASLQQRLTTMEAARG